MCEQVSLNSQHTTYRESIFCFGIDFWIIESIFDGSRIDFSKIKTNFSKIVIFSKKRILTRSDELQKNFYNEKALEIYQLLPCNQTRPKDKQPFIKHGLLSGNGSVIYVDTA